MRTFVLFKRCLAFTSVQGPRDAAFVAKGNSLCSRLYFPASYKPRWWHDWQICSSLFLSMKCCFNIWMKLGIANLEWGVIHICLETQVRLYYYCCLFSSLLTIPVVKKRKGIKFFSSEILQRWNISLDIRNYNSFCSKGIFIELQWVGFANSKQRKWIYICRHPC